MGSRSDARLTAAGQPRLANGKFGAKPKREYSEQFFFCNGGSEVLFGYGRFQEQTLPLDLAREMLGQSPQGRLLQGEVSCSA